MWDWAEPIRGLWRILGGKGESGLVSYSELWGSSLCPCRLRTDRLALVSKFDYVLMHTRFMGSRKLGSFGGHWVGRSLTSPVEKYTGILYGPPTVSPEWGIIWKTCTRERWDPTRLFDRCRELWPHVRSWRPHVCCVVRLLPCKVWIITSHCETLEYGWYLLVAVIL
jgi:hypothetical protein